MVGVLSTNSSPSSPIFQHKPISRLIAPGMQASHLHDDTLGRALDTLYAVEVTALYLLAAPAARGWG